MKKLLSYFLAACMACSMFAVAGNVSAKDDDITSITEIAEEVVEEEVETETTDTVVEVEEVKEEDNQESNTGDELHRIDGDDESIGQDNVGSYGFNKVTFSIKSAKIGVLDYTYGEYADLVTVVVTGDYSGYSAAPADFSLYTSDSGLAKLGVNNFNKSNNSSAKTCTITAELYGVKTGSVTLYAKASKFGKVYGSFKLTIKKAPKDVILSKKAITVSEGQTATIKASVPSGTASSAKGFYSSNTGIVTVTNDGQIKAIKEGTAYIYGMAYNGATSLKPCLVTVKPGPYSITCTGKNNLNYMKLKQSYTLKPTSYDKYGNVVKLVSYTYTSSNPAVATISSKGKITAKSLGKTTIKVTAHNGKSYSYSITVGETPLSIKLNAPERVAVGTTKTLTTSFTFAEGVTYRDLSLTYSSSKSSVISIDQRTGKMTAKKAGTATITVKSSNGKKSSVKITVY